nr:GntR family transcriptional regulator [Paraburkholderia kirstenboschensis]
MKDPTRSPSSRADHVCFSVRDDIFDLRLLPGDRMTESGIADRFGVAPTPAREALQHLQSDGLMRGHVRRGWEVVPIDFKRFEDRDEIRKLIETFSVSRLFGVDGTCPRPTCRGSTDSTESGTFLTRSVLATAARWCRPTKPFTMRWSSLPATAS